jgi:hypothetical protein
MTGGSVKITLRPLRLAFLVRPTEEHAVNAAVETASFLWGGAFSPIIPVYGKLPKFWGRDLGQGPSANSVVEGYLDAFDPDFVVTVGSLESQDLKFAHRHVIKCSEIVTGIEDDNTPAFGVGMVEVLQGFGDREFKFLRQHPVSISLPEIGAGPDRLFLKSVFGVLPTRLESEFKEAWKSLPGVQFKKCTLGNYSEFLSSNNLFLRRIGSIDIEPTSTWSFRRQDCIFFMNADSLLDIIDYWNLRASGWTVIPVCKKVADSPNVQQFATQFVEKNSFAFRSNPNLFNETMVLRSRTSRREDVVQFVQSLRLTQPKHPHESKIVYNFMYPRIWDEWARDKDSAEPCGLKVSEETYEMSGDKTIKFRSQLPQFAVKFGGHDKPRCANEIEVHIWSDDLLAAEVVPEGDWLLAHAVGAFGLDEAWRCGKRGLVHLPSHKDSPEHLTINSAESVFSEWLKNKGWETSLSNNGYIARQMLKHLGGVWAVGLLARSSAIELFEQFSIGRPKQAEKGGIFEADQNVLAKQESGRTLSPEAFHEALRKIASKDKYKVKDIDQLAASFIKKHMVQLGIKVQCHECRQRSWYSIKDADYELKCPQCLSVFCLPEHNPKEIKWAYRAIGPFSLPRQAHGVYSVLLTLRFFARQLHGATTPMLSFTAKKGTILIEADLGLFYQRSTFSPSRTDLVFAECKTFGCFERKDAARMAILAEQFPGAVLVFATLKKSLTNTEKRVLRAVVNRGRRYWKAERPYNPVLILTGNELFTDEHPRSVWRNLGGIYAMHEHAWGDDSELISLSDDTQQLYLGMKPWRESLMDRQKRANLRKKPGNAFQGDLLQEEMIKVSFPVAMRQVPFK